MVESASYKDEYRLVEARRDGAQDYAPTVENALLKQLVIAAPRVSGRRRNVVSSRRTCAGADIVLARDG
jgi:hypothetical protein